MKRKISENQVYEDYKNGLPEDFTLKGKKIRRKKVDLNDAMVQISIMIEYDLLHGIRQTAESMGLPYQTLIKQILREHLIQRPLELRVQRLEEKLAQLEATL